MKKNIFLKNFIKGNILITTKIDIMDSKKKKKLNN